MNDILKIKTPAVLTEKAGAIKFDGGCEIIETPEAEITMPPANLKEMIEAGELVCSKCKKTILFNQTINFQYWMEYGKVAETKASHVNCKEHL